MKNLYCMLICMFLAGHILAQTTSTIQGKVRYQNSDSTALASAKVVLVNQAGVIIDSTYSDFSGAYHFDGVGTGIYKLTAYPVHSWSGSNSTDALLVLKCFVHSITYTGLPVKAADVNGSGYLNTFDAFLIQKRFVGLSNNFPIADWVNWTDSVVITSPGVTNYTCWVLCAGDIDASYKPTNNGIQCPGLPVFSYGGKNYHTVLVGSRCWMKENLNIGTYVPSTSTGGGHSDAGDNGIIEKYCYNNDTANCSIYGGLYDWNELMNYNPQSGTQGICPTGWRVPGTQDWCTMATGLDPAVNCVQNGIWTGTTAGLKLRETGILHWNSPNTGATNTSGFSIVGGGQRVSNGTFDGFKDYAVFWTSSFQNSVHPYYWSANRTKNGLYHSNMSFEENAFSIRCIKDTCFSTPTQSNAGPNQFIIGTTTTLQGNSPTTGIGTWSIISGTGGVISQPTNPVSGFSGLPNTTYELAWTISTSCATSSDTVSVEFDQPPMGVACPGIPTLTYGGQVYNTVQIGTQCWLKENLNIGTFVSSTSTSSSHTNMSNNGIIEKYCYNNDTNQCAEYGALYDWNELMEYSSVTGAQGICPSGWHIPTDQDWCTLAFFVDNTISCNTFGSWIGSYAGGKLKENGNEHWNSPNLGATNEVGFYLFGAGQRLSTGSFSGLKENTVFWTSTWPGTGQPKYWFASKSESRMYHGDQSYKENGFSVRCIKNP
jgi:uncharacterized protein (TIGR02145 family)